MSMDPMVTQVMLFLMSVLAGLGLISLATRLLSEGLQLVMGPTIRKIINWLDHNDAIASVVGALTALMIQSRISTSVMSVSYANSRLMNLRQMAFFLLGTTCGTFLTPWIFVLDTYRLDLFLLALGILPMLHARWDKLAGVGRAVFALGLMLLGFDVIAFGATQPDQIAVLFRDLLDWIPVNSIGVLALALLALPFCFVVRSTVALLGATMALVFAGILSTQVAVVLTMGFNLGAVLPAIMASRKSNLTALKGVSYFAGIYLLAVVLLSFGFDSYWEWLTGVTERAGAMSSPAALTMAPMLSVPITHVVVNGLAMMIGFTLSPWVENIGSWFFKEPKKKQTQHLNFFGRPSQFAPSLALEQASQEVKKMAALVHTTLHMTGDSLKQPDEAAEKRALKYEGITDNILQELTVFLTKVMQASLSKKQSFESACLMQFAVELEKIADNCQDILELRKGINPSQELGDDIQKYFSAAVDCFEHVFPMLTDHFNIRPESIDAFLEDLESYVNDSLRVYDELLLQGLKSHQDYRSAVPIFNCIRKIVENTHSIVDLRQRFLLPETDLERV